MSNEDEINQVMSSLALGPGCRPAVESLLDTYNPVDITPEHVEAMMEAMQ